jgi:hypothetical protein
MSELTLGGYMTQHDRAPAFTGRDGQAYSVGLFVEEQPDARGRHAGSLVFVRWSPGGDRPVGHVDSEVLAWGRSVSETEERLKALSLYDVKTALDQAIGLDPGTW